jgi:hypothetical protein
MRHHRFLSVRIEITTDTTEIAIDKSAIAMAKYAFTDSHTDL